MEKSIQYEAINIITKTILENSYIRCIFIKGSIAREEYDQYSDIDYYCIVDEEYYSEFLSKRTQFMESYKKLIYFSESNFVGPQIVGVFDNGLHFDLYTLIEVPKYGTDAIKIIYDREGLLNGYKRIKNEPSDNQIVIYFNEFTFRLLEFEAAYLRKDLIWASKLGSHLLRDLSLILSYMYDSDKPYLGMKRLSNKLPKDIYNRIIKANNMITPNNILLGVQSLIELADIIYRELNSNCKRKINMVFYNFMKNKILSILEVSNNYKTMD